jgi:UDP-2,4-diacetamido-2,4,6-trideoxy-beta-L-altropyranose hydrolase
VLEGIEQLDIRAIPGSDEDAREASLLCNRIGSEWLVLDGYHFGTEYQQIIRSRGLYLLAIDDYAHADRYCVNLILNQNAYAHADLYSHILPETQLLLGCHYALLRREFWAWRDTPAQNVRTIGNHRVLRILITLGGSDPHNVTLRLLTALKGLDQLKINVVIGGSNPHTEVLQAWCNEMGGKVSLHANIMNMPDLMAESDLAISAGGSTCWELLLMGIPSILLVLAENQRLVAESLDSLNVAINLGWHEQITCDEIVNSVTQFLKNPNQLTTMSQNAVNLVDGYGAYRVTSAIRTYL